MKCGFLPVSQEAVLVGNVSYHDFYGVLVDKAERETIIKNLGNNNVCIHVYIAIGCGTLFNKPVCTHTFLDYVLA